MPFLKKFKILFNFDAILWLILAGVLIVHYLKWLPGKSGEFILIAIAVVSTLPIFWSAANVLKNKKFSVDLLASIALLVSLTDKQWTSVVFISLMITSARIFSDYTDIKSRQAIESLFKLKPQKAKVKKEGGFIEVLVEKVKKGDFVLVELGEKIPVDGIVEKGEAEVNQASLTGESVPVSKKEGDKVLSATIVSSGNLVIKAEKVGQETTFEKIISTIEKAQENKAPITAVSDKFSAWYIAITIFVSLILYIFSKNISLVLGVLLVSCADDVAVAIPLAFLASITHCARHGVIIKGGNYIEALAKLKVVIADKTGTLTKGKLKVEDIFAFDDKNPEEVLELAAVVSSVSSHPSAHAIIRYAKEKGIIAREPENFEEYPGKGASALYNGKKITSGNPSFFRELNFKISSHELRDIERKTENGFSATLIGYDDKVIGFISLADEVRTQAKEMVSRLEKLGVEKIVMLTGDNEKIAKRVADSVGIKEYHANLLPEDKLNYLKKYLSKKYKTAMIGDGVNDAAALSLADVGIAMGAIGSDASIESADIALMKDDLSQVPELIKIGKSALKIVRQDLLIWGVINIVGLVLVFGKVIGPQGAAAYNFITDFIPLFNSLRLFR